MLKIESHKKFGVNVMITLKSNGTNKIKKIIYIFFKIVSLELVDTLQIIRVSFRKAKINLICWMIFLNRGDGSR